jgi:hypothetical protein
MSGEPVAGAVDEPWDLLSRAEEAALVWIRNLRDEVGRRHGRAETEAFLGALRVAGAVEVGLGEFGPVAGVKTGTCHEFRRGDVEFSLEFDATAPAQIRLRFGRFGS